MDTLFLIVVGLVVVVGVVAFSDLVDDLQHLRELRRRG